jgi:tyrosine aminotransferase
MKITASELTHTNKMADWNLTPSTHSENTINPVREAVSKIKAPSSFPLPVHSLALGDPSAYPDFTAYPFVINAVSRCLLENHGNGYTDSQGWRPARETLASAFSYPNSQLSPDDVIIDIGGTGAIHTVLQVFLNPGDNILIPSPGFPLYKTMALNMEADAILYNLKPTAAWEVDLEDLEQKVNERTKMIVVVNPSNPCGSVFSREHLMEIIAWAGRHKICILADEVYHNMTFGKPHFPLGSLTDEVPVFTVGALSKIFLVPGWRCGWVLIYDKQNKCAGFRSAITKVKNMLLHPAPFIMQAIPEIFSNKPENYFEEVMVKIKVRAEVVKRGIDEIPQLHMEMPEGSLYAMVTVKMAEVEFEDTIQFAQKFAEEQGVIIMPAEAFLSNSAFRVVLCHPIEVLQECVERLKEFVRAHART